VLILMRKVDFSLQYSTSVGMSFTVEFPCLT
jgi:hypothetical protein